MKFAAKNEQKKTTAKNKTENEFKYSNRGNSN